jgi:hypothetical protein
VQTFEVMSDLSYGVLEIYISEHYAQSIYWDCIVFTVLCLKLEEYIGPKYHKFFLVHLVGGARGGAMVEALRNKPVLDGGGWAMPNLQEGETRCPLYRRLGGPQGWCVWVQKIKSSPAFSSWTVQPIAILYIHHIIHNINVSRKYI